MGAKKAYPVYFTTRWGIHTFGVAFPIDILILDKNHQVVKAAQSIAPNHFFFWLPIYKDVVELPAGEIKKRKILLGDLLVISL